VSVFGAAGESVARFLTKGRRIGLDGRLQWREWETAEGQHRQAVSIVADVVQFLDSPGAGSMAPGGQGQLSGEDDLGDEDLAGVGVEDLEVTF
jgi:single-strand DNA-binding protein